MADGQGSGRAADQRGIGRIARGVVLTLVLAACTPAPGATPTSPSANATQPVSTVSPTGTPAPVTTEPAPTETPGATPNPDFLGAFDFLPAEPPPGDFRIDCDGPLSVVDPVAIVQLEDARNDDLVLRNYVDVENPRTVCTFSGDDIRVRQLVDPRHVVIGVLGGDHDDLLAVVDLPEVRYRWFRLPPSEGWGSEFIAMRPALDRIVWKASDPDRSEDTITVTTASGNQVVATLPDRNSGRCGQPTDSMWGRYAAGGGRLYVLNQPTFGDEALLVVRDGAVELQILPPDRWAEQGDQPMMALWSPNSATLYFSQGGDVWRWTPGGGKQRFIAGVAWYDPTISADGRYLAYSAGPNDEDHDVFLVDLESGGSPRKIANGRAPRFLNASQLWFETGEGFGSCVGAREAKRIYDVRTGGKAGSIITTVVAAWPATSAQH